MADEKSDYVLKIESLLAGLDEYCDKVSASIKDPPDTAGGRSKRDRVKDIALDLRGDLAKILGHVTNLDQIVQREEKKEKS